MITCLSFLALVVCIVGLDEIIKFLRQIPLKIWLFTACFIIVFTAIVSRVIAPSKNIEMFVNDFFLERSSLLMAFVL
jgi:hypothetical protein